MDGTIQDDQLAGLRINSGAHQARRGGDDGIAFFRADEVVELLFAFFFVARDSHHVLPVFVNVFWQFVGQGNAHSFGVIDVVTKYDGFGVRISAT